MKQKTVDVIIPSYKPDHTFRDLLLALCRQDYPVCQILVINTGEEYFDDALTEGIPGAEVFHITKQEFDHAGTRNMGAGFAESDYLLFLTQDACPADEQLVGRLLAAFSDPKVKAAYARQLPKADCRIAEGCVRSFNYPEESEVRTIRDLSTLGIKTYFCSNTCAMYERRLFQEMGGFSAPSIFNEDMIYVGRILSLGYSVAYCADAEVFHSHNYTNLQQFRRNFDNGVSQAMHPEIFRQIRSEGEGMRLVRYVASSLSEMGKIYLFPGFCIQCAFRLLGFKLGKNYRKLPMWLVRHCSMNREFFDGYEEV
ncbi:MAG: glycosyltransferase family 2 protein [Lachnospiraceae bacterium]|nr:glycosyltransferase family 2 protein [Lachnospiraceae bacterium]